MEREGDDKTKGELTDTLKLVGELLGGKQCAAVTATVGSIKATEHNWVGF